MLHDRVIGSEGVRGDVLEGAEDLTRAKKVEEGGGGREGGREEEDASFGGGEGGGGKASEEEEGEEEAEEEVVPHASADDSELGEGREGGREGGMEEDVGAGKETEGEVNTKCLVTNSFFDGPPGVAPLVDEEGEEGGEPEQGEGGGGG
jgi:hypothetical protein